MQASLILELQELAARRSSDLTDLLRLCLMAATKLELKAFRAWVKCELDGYPNGDSVPEYRRVRTQLKAKGAFTPGWIPFYVQDRELEVTLLIVPVLQPVSSLEHILNTKGQTCMYALSGQEVHLIHKLAPDTHGMDITKTLDKSQLVDLLDAVRNNILDWALRIEGEGVLGEGMTFTRKEKLMARNITYNIRNLQGVAGEISGGKLSQTMTLNVHQGDLASLRRALTESGIADDDISDLEKAIRQDGELVKRDGFGSKVSKWIGGMFTKAAEGTISGGIETISSLVTSFLKSYYGLE